MMLLEMNVWLYRNVLTQAHVNVPIGALDNVPLFVHLSDTRERSYVNENDDDGERRTWFVFPGCSSVSYPPPLKI